MCPSVSARAASARCGQDLLLALPLGRGEVELPSRSAPRRCALIAAQRGDIVGSERSAIGRAEHGEETERDVRDRLELVELRRDEGPLLPHAATVEHQPLGKHEKRRRPIGEHRLHGALVRRVEEPVDIGELRRRGRRRFGRAEGGVQKHAHEGDSSEPSAHAASRLLSFPAFYIALPPTCRARGQGFDSSRATPPSPCPSSMSTLLRRSVTRYQASAMRVGRVHPGSVHEGFASDASSSDAAKAFTSSPCAGFLAGRWSPFSPRSAQPERRSEVRFAFRASAAA